MGTDTAVVILSVTIVLLFVLQLFALRSQTVSLTKAVNALSEAVGHLGSRFPETNLNEHKSPESASRQ